MIQARGNKGNVSIIINVSIISLEHITLCSRLHKCTSGVSTFQRYKYRGDTYSRTDRELCH